ncbi:MAG: phosphoribosylamine--glycine ligase [Gemmatimonadaceae bacterium]
MRVLLVGSGAREHALAWKLTRDDPSLDVIAAPGNPGIAQLARCRPVSATDLPAMLALARAERPDLTVIGPEAPLAAGLADVLRAESLPVFGPSAAAAVIESSKAYAKALLVRAGVPTARAEVHSSAEGAFRAARAFGAPVVIKASGLAAGKGAVVCETIAEADTAIEAMLVSRALGDAGSEVLVEEFMEGEELSIFGITDGTDVIPMLPIQDHKRLLEADRGPNTGGMGAYAPVSVASAALTDEVVARIFRPTLEAMRGDGRRFTGLLYAGIMLTGEGPRVVEFNCRFGDPETQAILPLLESNLLAVLHAVARGDSVAGQSLVWRPDAAVTTVVAASGYPDAPRRGDAIEIDEAPDSLHFFHAGTAETATGELVTAGGRVLAVTAVARTIEAAQASSAAGAGGVHFAGRQFRRDIGWREIARGRTHGKPGGAGRAVASETARPVPGMGAPTDGAPPPR